VEHRRAQKEHGKVVGKLEVLAEGGVVEEGANAKNQKGYRHKVIVGFEKSPTSWAVHVFKSKKYWRAELVTRQMTEGILFLVCSVSLHTIGEVGKCVDELSDITS